VNDRESLDAQEPRELEEPVCPLCGTRVAHPWEPGGTVLCHPDRGGCGANVRPVPYLVSSRRSGESGGEPLTGPARTTWERCCDPFAPPRPSGRRLRHSQRCALYPELPLTPGELEGRVEELRSRADHPTTITTTTGNPGVVMIRDDAAYMDAHLDDDDDR